MLHDIHKDLLALIGMFT